MPLEILVGYIIADSIMAHGKTTYPTAQAQDNFIYGLTCGGDTLKYLMKYLYRMADYNPILYYNFLTSSQAGKQQPMSILPKLLNHIGDKCGFPTKQVMKAEYILHIRVNEVEQFAYESRPPWTDPNSGKIFTDSSKLVYVYSQVLDTIKGQVLPNIGSGITIFTIDTLKDTAGMSEKRMKPYLEASANTDFIYHYNPYWRLKNKKGNWERNMEVKEKVDNEYIVFSYNMGTCVSVPNGRQYYEIRPTVLGFMGGIFPIKDGNVVDIADDLGWGTEVPLEEFKERLQKLIDSIKNYGE